MYRCILLCVLLGASTSTTGAERNATLRIGVVGDTGIGPGGFAAGYEAVVEKLWDKKPHVLLHLGDYVYVSDEAETDPKNRRAACYVEEIQKSLFGSRHIALLTDGDNDRDNDPKCWSEIRGLGASLERKPQLDSVGGVKVIGNTLFALIGEKDDDPTAWLGPYIDAHRNHKEYKGWVIVSVHTPPVTTAWFESSRVGFWKRLAQLKPDLVLSGHQHAYERFHALGIPKVPLDPADTVVEHTTPGPEGSYHQGGGAVHIVSGGGGAKLRPFADHQVACNSSESVKRHEANESIVGAIAKRAVMNHYLMLEVSDSEFVGTVYRVCAGDGEQDAARDISEHIPAKTWQCLEQKFPREMPKCEKPQDIVFDSFRIVAR